MSDLQNQWDVTILIIEIKAGPESLIIKDATNLQSIKRHFQCQ